MKYIVQRYGPALIISFIYSTFLFPAQPKAQSGTPNTIKTNQPSSSPANTRVKLRMNEISAGAARHFATHFSANNNEKWTIIDGFYIASFSDAQIRTEAFYTIRGSFAYCVKYYAEAMLSQDIRLAILKKFEDHKIDVVTEISTLEDKLYFIKIKSSADIKTLKVLNGEIEVTEEFKNVGT